MTNANELLRRVLDAWDDEFQNIDNASVFSEIRTYLSNPSDDAEEPVGYQWLHSGHFRKQIPKNANAIEWYPLYLHPPKPAEPAARKPMTGEELENLFRENHGNFETIVRAVEKHHGVGGDDEQ